MLLQIDISGLAIIDQASIEFHPGFNVITGETGAGKTILIKALNLLQGAKGEPELIRQGLSEAQVSGTFRLNAQHPVKKLLESFEIPFEEEKKESFFDLIVRRQIKNSGRSSVWVNDTPISIQTLKEIGLSLIDISSQHENQTLLNIKEHLLLLDTFLNQSDLLDTYKKLWSQTHEKYKALHRKIKAITSDQRGLDFLQFRFQELKDFNPIENEYEDLIEKVNTQSAIRERSEALKEIQEGLDHFQNEKSLSSCLRNWAKKLDQKDEDTGALTCLKNIFDSSAAQLDEASFEVSQALSQMELDPEELESWEERIASYQSYFRKFSIQSTNASKELVEELEKLDKRISDITSFQLDAEKVCKEILEESKILKGTAENLHQERLRAEKIMLSAILDELEDLGMKNCHLAMDWQEVKTTFETEDLEILSIQGKNFLKEAFDILSQLNGLGAYSCQILMSANKGEALIPLYKVASGGELSRMMLALKKSLSKHLQTILFVFDEVDTGVSGRIAEAIGKKIHELSKSTQIICISHLPQVAAFSDAHFRVSKKQIKDRTVSQIICLDEKEKVEEIASLLSGKMITDSSREQAKRLMGKN